jgi:hypothetical protein
MFVDGEYSPGSVRPIRIHSSGGSVSCHDECYNAYQDRSIFTDLGNCGSAEVRTQESKLPWSIR